MTPSEELDKMVNELDRKGQDADEDVDEDMDENYVRRMRCAIRPQRPLMISVPLKEWSDMTRRVGYLEGIISMALETGNDNWMEGPWRYYQRVMLGLPVTTENSKESSDGQSD